MFSFKSSFADDQTCPILILAFLAGGGAAPAMYPGKPLAPALQLAQDAKEARTRELVKFAAATEAREALASQRDRHLSEHEHRVRLVEEHNHFQLLEVRDLTAQSSSLNDFSPFNVLIFFNAIFKLSQ
jgi:hypothetical protein